MNIQYVNYIETTNGKVQAVCCCCGRISTAVIPDTDGQPDLAWLPAWVIVPSNYGFVHVDGSVGSKWNCPSCDKKLSAHSMKKKIGLRDIGNGPFQVC